MSNAYNVKIVITYEFSWSQEYSLYRVLTVQLRATLKAMTDTEPTVLVARFTARGTHLNFLSHPSSHSSWPQQKRKNWEKLLRNGMATWPTLFLKLSMGMIAAVLQLASGMGAVDINIKFLVNCQLLNNSCFPSSFAGLEPKI